MSFNAINKYLPYMKYYDEVENVWSPYIVLKQQPNINNETLNTDKFGFRYTDSNGKYTIVDDTPSYENDEQLVITGNSTAFGIGSSSDKKTISSNLSNLLRRKVYNLSLRTCNSFQELILFLQVLDKFKNLKTVIIVSGFNDILIDRYVTQKSIVSPPLFYQNKIDNFAIDFTNSFWHKLFLKNFLKKKSKTFEDKSFNWKKNFEKNLKIWKSLSKEFNFNIIFALQPYYKWSKQIFSSEEKEIFHEIENKKIKTYEVLKNFNQDDYKKIDFFFSDICKKNNISYLDLNKTLKSFSEDNKWLFADALHLTDLGYKIVSKKISSILK